MITSNEENEQISRHTKRFGRELAMQYLFCCELNGEIPGVASFENVVEMVKNEFGLTDSHLSRRGGAYASQLYELVAIHKDEIDATLISLCTDAWPWERIAFVERNIMRVAAAEMMYVEGLNPAIAISEAIKIAIDYAGVDSVKFVNGILNAFKEKKIDKAK